MADLDFPDVQPEVECDRLGAGKDAPQVGSVRDPGAQNVPTPAAEHFFLGTGRHLNAVQDVPQVAPVRDAGAQNLAAPPAEHFFLGTGRHLNAVQDTPLADISPCSVGREYEASWSMPPNNVCGTSLPDRLGTIISTVQSIDVLPSPANTSSTQGSEAAAAMPSQSDPSSCMPISSINISVDALPRFNTGAAGATDPPCERLRALDLTPPSSAREANVPAQEMEIPSPCGATFKGAPEWAMCDSGNLAAYKPGSTQHLLLPTMDELSAQLDEELGVAPAPKAPSTLHDVDIVLPPPLEATNLGVADKRGLDPVPPAGATAAMPVPHGAAKSRAPPNTQANVGTKVPSTSRDNPRPKASSAAAAAKRGAGGQSTTAPSNPGKPGSDDPFRVDARRGKEGSEGYNPAGPTDRHPRAGDSHAPQPSRGQRRSDGFMEDDNRTPHGYVRSEANQEGGLVDMALRWAGLQEPGPEERLQEEISKLLPNQIELLSQLIALGFEQVKAIEAVKRCSSVEAAVEWMLQHK